MLRKILPSIIFLAFINASFAQKTEEEEEAIDTKTLAFGVTTSNYTGLIGGLIARSSTPISNKNGKTTYQYIGLEILNLKNPRESNQFAGFGPRYVYGKRNYLLSIRPQYGREFTLFQRTKDSNIGLSLIAAAGPSIGLLKPYYVKYQDQNSYVQYDPNIRNSITAVGGLLKNGFKGIKLNPGLHAKLASNIDINTFNDNVTGFEIGTTIEYFFKKPEIITPILSDNPQTFVSVYLTLYFGNKKIVQPKKKTSKKSGNGID